MERYFESSAFLSSKRLDSFQTVSKKRCMVDFDISNEQVIAQNCFCLEHKINQSKIILFTHMSGVKYEAYVKWRRKSLSSPEENLPFEAHLWVTKHILLLLLNHK